MDPQFHALLCGNKVRTEDIKALETAGVDSAKMFGHIAKTDEKFALFIKRICNVDPEARGEDAVPSARLYMAWEACKKRAEVEFEAEAQRAVNRLPVQLAIDDH